MASEKLTIAPPLTIRATETQARRAQKLADLAGMEKGEFVRYLLNQAWEREQRIWLDRNQLFAGEPIEASNTASDSV